MFLSFEKEVTYWFGKHDSSEAIMKRLCKHIHELLNAKAALSGGISADMAALDFQIMAAK